MTRWPAAEVQDRVTPRRGSLSRLGKFRGPVQRSFREAFDAECGLGDEVELSSPSTRRGTRCPTPTSGWQTRDGVRNRVAMVERKVLGQRQTVVRKTRKPAHMSRRESAEVDLARKGIAVQDYGTRLIRAVADDDLELIEMLLAAGADVNGEPGRPALFHAAGCGRSQSAGMLIRAGAVIDRRSGPIDQTPLIRGAWGGHTAVVELLLGAGAAIEAVDSTGATALWRAASAGRGGTVAALLRAGADPNARNRAGETPLATALYWRDANGGETSGFDAVVAALKLGGALS